VIELMYKVLVNPVVITVNVKMMIVLLSIYPPQMKLPSVHTSIRILIESFRDVTLYAMLIVTAEKHLLSEKLVLRPVGSVMELPPLSALALNLQVLSQL
jgi:hypothetical protein